MSSLLDCVDVGTGCISPEQRLFVGIIAAAVMDATGGVRGGDTPITAGHSKALAREWFTDAGPDFHMVCTFAGFEPLVIRRRVLTYLDRVNLDPSQTIKLSRSRTGPTSRSQRAPLIGMGDVAEHAGVSVITVSRVLDGVRHVKDDTRARVLASVEAVGYVPSRRRATSVH
jgi:hypothetical protein